MISRLQMAAVICIFVAISSTFSPANAQNTSSPRIDPIPIDRFLSGVRVQKGKEYKVSDFQWGDHRVTGLFEAIPVPPSQARGHSPDVDLILVRVKNNEAFIELKELVPHNKIFQIDVIIAKDTIGCRMSAGWGAPPDCYQIIPIPFTIEYATPCEEVTRVIYIALAEEMGKRIGGGSLAGDSRAPITLDQSFSLLLVDKAESYIKTRLKPADQNNDCFHQKFALYKWLRNEEVEGYNLTDYSIHQGLRDVLSGIAHILSGMKYERYHFEIELIGYADQSPFQEAHKLSPAETGIEGWYKGGHPPEIYYKGCQGDKVDKEPTSIGFGEQSAMLVGSEIDNNCALGATRAYVAAAFLKNLLGTDGIEYRYGTGGIIKTNDRSQDYLNRRVEIRVVAKSAERIPHVRNLRLRTD